MPPFHHTQAGHNPFEMAVQTHEHATPIAPRPVPPDCGFLDSGRFDLERFCREWLVEGILVRGQPAVMGGAKKTLKTSLMLDLAISLGTGTPFLGTFAVPRHHRVGVLSAESGEATLQETARRICAARQVHLSDCAVWWCFTAPSLDRAKDRQRLADFLRQERIDVLFVDPLYLCLLSGGERVEAANIYEMGPLLRRIGQTCLDAGTTPVLVHHTRKSTPKMLPELDDLAYAGIAEYVRQWLLVGRTLPYNPGSGDHALVMAAGGSAGHAGCWAVRVQEGNLHADFTGRRWDVKSGTLSAGFGEGLPPDRA
jgi:replicative DNA helicase